MVATAILLLLFLLSFLLFHSLHAKVEEALRAPGEARVGEGNACEMVSSGCMMDSGGAPWLMFRV